MSAPAAGTAPRSAPTAEIALADPAIGDAEVEAVTRVLRSGRLSAGPETRRFEDEFARGLGASDAVFVSSGTSALHLACAALGLGPGDEVVVPSLTFVATAAAVRSVGATPVFADVLGPEEPSLDPAAAAAALTDRTRAILPVHYGGWPARMDELADLAAGAGLALVEDAAHAPLVDDGGGALGTRGDVGCFSFHATKNVTSGEGGMVVARDPAVLGRVRELRSHARVPAAPGTRPLAGDVDVSGVGLNHRPTDLAAAIGRVQLGRLDEDREARRRLVARYRTGLAPLPVRVVGRADAASAHHLFPVLLPEGCDRAAVRARLRAAGVATAVHYPPVHLLTAYRTGAGARPGALPRTEAMAPGLLSLPLHRRLADGDVDRVVAALGDALADVSAPVPAHVSAGAPAGSAGGAACG